jgi:signal transduction histidine kinase
VEPKSVQILLVEDNPGDARLLREALRDVQSNFEITHVGRFGDARERLAAGTFDAILLDLGLPDADGLEMVDSLAGEAPLVPVVVLTGRNDERLAVDAVRAGAEDYLVKGQVDGQLLVRSVRYAIERHRLIVQLREHNRQLEHFAFATAHDLKAPLANVEQSIELLACDTDARALSELSRQGLQGIERASARMRRLVTDLLVLARTGSGVKTPERVDLGECARSAVGNFQTEIDKRGIDVRIAAELPALTARLADVQAVLDNLVGNAIKYGACATAPIVEIGCERRAAETLLWVRDNGAGFDPAEADRVFEPYHRLSAGQDGTGLGLAIVRKAIESHGGRAWIETAPERGTTVFFTLPAAGTAQALTSGSAHESAPNLE